MAGNTQVKPIPDGFHSLTPYLYVNDCSAALDFYAEAFSATERFRIDGPPGKIGHAEMRIGDSIFMVADEMAEWGNRSRDIRAGYQGGCEAGQTRRESVLRRPNWRRRRPLRPYLVHCHAR